jgi:hypothetical protein
MTFFPASEISLATCSAVDDAPKPEGPAPIIEIISLQGGNCRLRSTDVQLTHVRSEKRVPGVASQTPLSWLLGTKQSFDLYDDRLQP